jgi:nitroimidazol reductase NimA-like FMN-containing flavoprotein (pyridoxamine 5'-phosphate oxidase superfamily)
MEKSAIDILDLHRIMAISTLRPDGWPQTTIVGYVNDGLRLYFLIFRPSQKFANIERDDRVSIAVSEEPWDISQAKAVYAGARASEVKELGERQHAWQLLMRRHPNLAGSDIPERSVTALMRAVCSHFSVLDYSKGLGHTDEFAVAAD